MLPKWGNFAKSGHTGWHLIAPPPPPSTSDVLGEVGLHLALGLVSFYYDCKTDCMLETYVLLAEAQVYWQR